MDPRIARLKSTTFYGQRFTRKQIARILDVVETFPLLSRSELALTVCEQLRLQTPSGNNRLSTALNTLAELQDLGLLTLPPPRKQGGRGPQKPLKPSSRTAPQPAVEGPLAALGPVRLALADGRGQVREWNAWVDRYHPLGYRQPIGAHLRYFVLDGQGRKLGCLLFDFAVRKVACRDEWIGWAGQKYRKHLKLVVRNARFLLFPWVGVKNLASHVLGLAARQVAADWQRQHRYRPVLLETYVDSERYAGTCYRAAGWQCVGKTQGRKAQGRNPAVTPKAVYVRPLHPRWQQALLQGPRALARKKSAARATTPPPRAAERTAARERFLQMWARVLADVVRVTSEWDREWMQRRRLLNTLLLVLFVFRLVLAPRNQGYAATATELWDQCRQLDIPLPQSQPVSPGALSRARAKIHPQAFLRVHRAVLQHAPRDDPRALWRGHRVFAVDGSKLNLPRPLLHDGYRLPSETAHYPQGLLSCLYQLRTQLPVDFDLVSHNDERRAALAHLEALAPGEVAVYDRGYYSFRLLHTHCARGVQAVFRLKKNANGPFRAFIRSALSADEIVIEPSATARAQLPDTLLRPCRVRLVKYTAGATSFALATTLLDARAYPARALADLYHGRWSIEELYKISKQMLTVEYFHSRSERGVKQELFAHFTLIAMTRLFTNHTEGGFRSEAGKPPMQANFQNAMRTMARNVAGLLLQYSTTLCQTVGSMLASIAHCRQRQRPGRSYPRKSRKPASKWKSSNKPAETKTKQATHAA